jgi:small subunit ribosomal protein S9
MLAHVCVLQVFVWRGSGRVLVNRKPIDAYFPDLLMRSAALKPLSVTGLIGQVDVLVQVGQRQPGSCMF